MACNVLQKWVGRVTIIWILISVPREHRGGSCVTESQVQGVSPNPYFYTKQKITGVGGGRELNERMGGSGRLPFH